MISLRKFDFLKEIEDFLKEIKYFLKELDDFPTLPHPDDRDDCDDHSAAPTHSLKKSMNSLRKLISSILRRNPPHHDNRDDDSAIPGRGHPFS